MVLAAHFENQARVLEVAGRKAPKPKKPGRPRFPINAQLRYFRKLRRFVALMRRAVLEHVIPKIPQVVAAVDRTVNPHDGTSKRNDSGSDGQKCSTVLRSDGYSELIGAIFHGLGIAYAELVSDEEIEKAAASAGAEVAAHNRDQIGAMMAKVIGVDVFSAEPWLAEELASFTAANVALIKSIPTTFFAQIERMVRDTVRTGIRHEELADQIYAQFLAPRAGSSAIKKARRQAQLIARDQVASFNGNLTRVRQQHLGIKRYRWRTSRDVRVVGNPSGLYPKGNQRHGNHYDREGQIFEWSKPPHDGHPGQPIQCRCVAEPVIEDLVPGLELDE